MDSILTCILPGFGWSGFGFYDYFCFEANRSKTRITCLSASLLPHSIQNTMFSSMKPSMQTLPMSMIRSHGLLSTVVHDTCAMHYSHGAYPCSVLMPFECLELYCLLDYSLTSRYGQGKVSQQRQELAAKFSCKPTFRP